MSKRLLINLWRRQLVSKVRVKQGGPVCPEQPWFRGQLERMLRLGSSPIVMSMKA